MQKFTYLVLAMASALAMSSAAVAKPAYHALLIGVSAYPDLPMPIPGKGTQRKISTKLEGPKTDVQLIWNMLSSRKDEEGKPLFKSDNVTILADSLPSAFTAKVGAKQIKSVPSDKNIREAFTSLIARVKKGDFVFIYMSGHGTQVPALADAEAKEADGLDEVFVPINVGRWDKAKNIDRFIRDDEIGAWIAKLNRNAFVWIVIDACHAGDATRGGPGYRTRFIDPALLLGPNATEREYKARQDAGATRGGYRSRSGSLSEDAISPSGRFVAFYAVQSNQLAVERRLPRGSDPVVGVFTYALIRAINDSPDSSYRELGRLMRSTYDRFMTRDGQPLFEGGGLGFGVFGGTKVKENWSAKLTLTGADIDAGLMQDVSKGSIVGLYRQGQCNQKAGPLGYVKVTRAELLRSTAAPVAYGGVAALKPGAYIDQKLCAIMKARSVSFNFRVAEPPPDDYEAVGSERADEVREAIAKTAQAFKKEGKIALQITPRAAPGSGDGAQLYLRLKDDRICILGDPGNCALKLDARNNLRPSPNFKIESGHTADRLYDYLWRAGRTLNLLRLYGDYEKGLFRNKFASAKRNLEITASVAKYPQVLANKRLKDGEPHKCVGSWVFQNPALSELSLDKPDRLAPLLHCDALKIELRNRGPTPIDVTVLYLDSALGILSTRKGASIRIEAGGRRDDWLQVTTWDEDKGLPQPGGREQVLIIAVNRDSKHRAEIADFSFLEQPGLEATKAYEDNKCAAGKAKRHMSPRSEVSSTRSRWGCAAEFLHRHVLMPWPLRCFGLTHSPRRRQQIDLASKLLPGMVVGVDGIGVHGRLEFCELFARVGEYRATKPIHDLWCDERVDAARAASATFIHGP